MSDSPNPTPDFWRKARKLAGRLPFVKDAAALYFAMMDMKTPLWAKSLIAGALGYFVAPVDAIPDLLVVVGYTDDAAVITGTVALVGSIVTDEHRDQAEDLFR